MRKTTAAAATALCVIALIGLFGGYRFGTLAQIALVGLPLLIVLASLSFTVRGYVLTEDAIEIKRLGWRTRLPLMGLKTVEGKADAMHGSIRLLGNGGLFAFTGYYWNRRLKGYRAFATDPSRAVILRYPDRTVVITPHDPQHFIMRARTLMQTAGFPE